ncbi:MAG: hypothetical protein ABSB82_14270 [Terriglobia bacterium]|jgi:hypothetical protein
MPSHRSICHAVQISVLAILSVGGAHGETKYFPDKGLDFDQRGHDMKVAWYSKQLSAMREPSLFELSKDKEARSYRFLWLRTFHHPIAVRLDLRREGGGVLTTKMANGQGGFRNVSDLIENRTREVSREEVDRFLQIVKTSDFWHLPTFEAPGGLDGAQWIVEGVEDGKYQIVDRWSPQRGRYKGMCIWLLGLSGLRIPSDEVY